MNAPVKPPVRPAVLQGFPIVDADTHVTEAHDLWTSRAPARFKDRVPQVKTLGGNLVWSIDGDRSLGPAAPSCTIRKDGSKAGGAEFLGFTIDDVTPASYDVKSRVAYMDSTGVAAQIAYPNVLGFGGQKAMMVDPELRLMSTQIYNDAMAEMQVASGERIFPMALTPWWDVKLAMAEIERCHKMGLRGVNTNSEPHTAGIPDMGDAYWTPFWEMCSDLGMPINFHIGASDDSMSWWTDGMWPSHTPDQWMAYGSTQSGQFEVYVTSYPETRGRWQISTGGGRQPAWSSDGRELFYRDFAGAMIAVPVTLSPTFEAGPGRKLFQNPAFVGAGASMSDRT